MFPEPAGTDDYLAELRQCSDESLERRYRLALDTYKRLRAAGDPAYGPWRTLLLEIHEVAESRRMLLADLEEIVGGP
ncbi:MAG: hypothetical protein ACRDS9_21585 [Pseudonocardiaceae bacterium]